MAQKRHDYAKIFKNGEQEVLYARGILTIEVIGLAKSTTGKYVTPTYKMDEEGNMQNFFFKENSPLPLYTFKGDGKEKLLEQPELTGKTKEKRLLLWVNNKGEDSWFKLEAWEVIAKRLNMFYRKGQEVVIIAHKVVSKGAEKGKEEVIWVIDDINKVEKDFVYSKPKNKENPTVENDGFSVIDEEEDKDLPFNKEGAFN